MNEIWKAIPGFPGYQASNLGRIKALATSIKHKQRFRGQEKFSLIVKKRKEKILKPQNCPNGDSYNRFRVTLSRPLEKAIGFYVHRLVWTSFNGEIPSEKLINHIDFNATNNRLDNLEIVSHEENMRHSAKAGRWPKKITHLTEIDIFVIRKSKRTYPMLARLFKIKESHVGDIKRRRAYSWVVGEL